MEQVTELVFRQQSEHIKELKTQLETIINEFNRRPSSVEKSLITRWAHGGLDKLELATKSTDNRQRAKYILEAEALLSKINGHMKK